MEQIKKKNQLFPNMFFLIGGKKETSNCFTQKLKCVCFHVFFVVVVVGFYTNLKYHNFFRVEKKVFF